MAHISTFFQRPDKIRKPLYVLTTVFNSPRYRSRWRLYEDFKRQVQDHGAILYTAEVAFGEREFSLTQPDDPLDLQLRTHDELWTKERALNLLIRKLPYDWSYVAWVDADVTFLRQDWANETIHLLQHYDVIQMWSEAHDLGPQHQVIQSHKSFGWHHSQGHNPDSAGGHNIPYYGKDTWHSGYAWACTRRAWDGMGGLIDFAICGAADYHMAWALIGQMERTIDKGLSPGYKAWLRRWGQRADCTVKRNLGVMNGGIMHAWHGPKAKRGYNTRGQILVKTQFDPAVDLHTDFQGLYQISNCDGKNNHLRDLLRGYLHSRDEDSSHLEE
jgi:hypothetical protein